MCEQKVMEDMKRAQLQPPQQQRDSFRSTPLPTGPPLHGSAPSSEHQCSGPISSSPACSHAGAEGWDCSLPPKRQCSQQRSEQHPAAVDEPCGRTGARITARLRGYANSLKPRDALETALSSDAGQACLVVFALQTFVFTCIHMHQLLGSERFVNAPGRPLPHESMTLRWVRVIDCLCSGGWSFFLLWLSRQLRQKRMLGAHGKYLLLFAMNNLAIIYTVAALVDFGQCHLQAGGIGRHCNGYNCMQMMLVMALTNLVGEYQPQVFCAVCFGGQGAYRLLWALREDRPLVVQSIVCTSSILLILFPLVLYVEEIMHWQIGLSKCDTTADEDKESKTCVVLRNA